MPFLLFSVRDNHKSKYWTNAARLKRCGLWLLLIPSVFIKQASRHLRCRFLVRESRKQSSWLPHPIPYIFQWESNVQCLFYALYLRSICWYDRSSSCCVQRMQRGEFSSRETVRSHGSDPGESGCWFRPEWPWWRVGYGLLKASRICYWTECGV